MTPLEGLRVLDLSRLLPGPFCTQLLADAGAEVIKVEEPQGGDYLRHMPPLLGDGASAFFHAINRGKKSVTLDLKDARDRAHFLALVRTADVVVESFRPGVLEKLGLAPARLLAENPRLVVCRISGYGQEPGPLRTRAGHDVNFLARAGVFGMMRAPALLPVQVADLGGGALPAAFQICAALLGRARTGRGTVIDVSMAHGAFGLAVSSYVQGLATGEPVGAGRDALVGRVPCYGIYACRDGYLAVGALEPKFWHGLCDVLALPELKDRGLDDGEPGDEVRAALAARLLERTRAEWSAAFAQHDVCVEVVRTPEEAMADPGFPSVEVEVAGKPLRLPVPPLGFAGVTPSCQRAPSLGQHNDAILAAVR